VASCEKDADSGTVPREDNVFFECTDALSNEPVMSKPIIDVVFDAVLGSDDLLGE
jgi:hypothetical protein